MKVKANKDYYNGKFFVKIEFSDFTDEEVFYITRFAPFKVHINLLRYGVKIKDTDVSSKSFLLEELSNTEFEFVNIENAKQFVEIIPEMISNALNTFISSLDNFIGETTYEIKIGEKVKKISEGARKALDKNSPEYNEIINKNREAFEKLSKL
ncbi:MAG: hypothetical protein HYZ33_03085 [Ignavibacteriales bacterium]|nr:hypothetical protein [Ignavibacteriales bacterium]